MWNSLLAAVYTVCWAVAAILLIPFMPRNRYLDIARGWARSLLWLCGITVHLRGMEHVEKDRVYLVMANHQSLFDIPLINALMNIRIRFLAKKSLGLIPIFGWYLWAGRYIFIDRSNPRVSHRSIEAAVPKLKQGPSLAIFPEGTRSPDGRLQPLKRGGFILAIESQVPILPVGIAGTVDVLSRSGWLIRSGPVAMAIGRPIDTTRFTRETRADLLQAVERELRRLTGEAAGMLALPPGV